MVADYNQPMQSLWNNADAGRCDNELALRAYGSRLLGGDPSLVLHGGGNTSIKLDENGETVLYVKGTGSNLATVDERAFTPLRVDGVSTLLALPELDNARMMRELDACLKRRPAPRPSIETLLHAGLPYRCVEHTHADAVLAAMNVENMTAVHAEVYGERAPLVPYHHSGHALARACMQVFDTQRTGNTIGLILAFHGVVAFGDSVHASYENMIELVTRAEHYLQARGAWRIPRIPEAEASPIAPEKLAGMESRLKQAGYHTALMKGRYPVACLFLEIDPAAVDVMRKIADKHGLYFMEDNCESMDAEVAGLRPQVAVAQPLLDMPHVAREHDRDHRDRRPQDQDVDGQAGHHGGRSPRRREGWRVLGAELHVRVGTRAAAR